MVVVFVLPVADDHTCLCQRPEAVDVEAFVADAGVERFDVAVAPGLAGRDEVQPDLAAGPVGHGVARQFGSVVATQDGRVCATSGGCAVEFIDEVITGDAALDHVAEAVAVSGLSATRRERRRAVVLLLGRGDLEASDFDAGRAARYLARLGVPLHVWRLAPPESPVAPGWPKGLDVTTTEGLQAAFRTLREDLAAQRVIWLEGRVDPSKVEVSSSAGNLVRPL